LGCVWGGGHSILLFELGRQSVGNSPRIDSSLSDCCCCCCYLQRQKKMNGDRTEEFFFTPSPNNKAMIS
jgi:hypothetical protein